MQLSLYKIKLTNFFTLRGVKKDGVIVILSSPSGAGKTTLVKKISLRNNKNFSNIKKTYFDLIFHLAADKRATTGEELPAEVSMQNILSTRNVCRLKFKKIIFASTCKAADPITSYGASKLILSLIHI